MRQLLRRIPRRDYLSRYSRASKAAMLASMDLEQNSLQLENTRSRTMSPGSAILLK